MSNEPHLNLSDIVEEVASLFIEPYQQFVTKLHTEGRITDAELLGLRHQVEARSPRLGELVQERLRQDDASR